MLICEMAAYYHAKGMNLYDALIELYDEYGYYLEDLKSITLAGKEGLEKIACIMEYFRTNKLETIGGKEVAVLEDYKSQERSFLDGAKDVEKIELPKANVIKFILEGGSWIALRPSGTEPKLKIYGGVKGNSLEESRKQLSAMITYMEEKMREI